MKNFLSICFLFIVFTAQAQDLSSKRLNKLITYRSGKQRPDTEYDLFYDASGKLKKVNYYQDGKLFNVTDNYKYDETGKLLSYDTKNTGGISPRRISIEYDQSGRRTKKWESVMQDGKEVTGKVTHYNYKNETLTRIKEQSTFGGNIYDTVMYKIDGQGFIKNPSANTAHINPMMLTGNAEVDMDDNAEWPLSEYFKETPVVYEPTFGTTTTSYRYDRQGLLTSSHWKYITEKENLLTASGSTAYVYTDISKKEK